MLLREQLRGGHERGLAPARHRRQRGERRDHRFPGADVALQEPVHRAVPREVGPDLPRGPALCRRQLEGQRIDEPAGEPAAAVERRRAAAVEPAPQHAQGEVVCEQLLEREAPPAGVLRVERRIEVRPRRRTVDRPQGLAEGDEAVAGLDPAGQELGDARVAVETVERLADQAA